MSNKEFTFFNIENDPRYQKIWLAGINSKEFQRLMKFENCEHISVPSICDEITLKLIEEATSLMSTEFPVRKPWSSFFVASELFIGLIYVHEQQTKFLYELVSRCPVPNRFLIENQNLSLYGSCEDLYSPKKKVLKRKSLTKDRQIFKRKSSFAIDKSDGSEDFEIQNAATMELLKNAFVASNADITIRESFNDPIACGLTEPTLFDEPFGEDATALEQCNFDLMSTHNHEQSTDEPGVPMNMLESTRRPSAETYMSDTIYGESIELENTAAVSEDLTVMSVSPEPMNDSMKMETLEEGSAPDTSNLSTQKRKRTKRHPPFKDLTLNINVKANVRTVSTTQRHSNAKDDSVSKTTCLSNLSSRIFDTPSHSNFSESMQRQFESRSISHKLLQSFKRMTLTKIEETNPDMVQEFFCIQPDDNQSAAMPDDHQSAAAMPSIENSIPEVALHCENLELLPQTQDDSVDTSKSYDEGMSQTFLETTTIGNQHNMSVELSPVIRQILATNESVNSYSRCDTDSQKLFASRSRQNKLDWGPEGVLQKLILLWNSGISPIGMNELMQSSKQRISAATAFFSIMDLNSARVGLINLIKSPDSNVIYNIIKSPKLIELQQQMM